MKPNTKETLVIAIMAIVLETCIIGIILLIFLVSGNQSLLEDMLNISVSGGVYGMTISAIGPMAMWIAIVFILNRTSKNYTPPGSIKLILSQLPKDGPEQVPPLKLPNPEGIKCTYTIIDNAHPEEDPIFQDKETKIKTREGINYIWIVNPGVANAEVTIKLEYDKVEDEEKEKQKLISDSYLVNEGYAYFSGGD